MGYLYITLSDGNVKYEERWRPPSFVTSLLINSVSLFTIPKQIYSIINTIVTEPRLLDDGNYVFLIRLLRVATLVTFLGEFGWTQNSGHRIW